MSSTVTGQQKKSEETNQDKLGPKTTRSGPIPPYKPLPSGLLEELPKLVICD